MNERILELAEQAGFYITIDGSGILIPDPHTEDITEVTKKFAELIVRECVIRAEREWIRNGPDTEHNKAITGVIKSIKEHFGVES